MTTSELHNSKPTLDEPAIERRPVAVIDIGTTSIRMAVAQIHGDGEFTRLETLSRAANLGRDSFTAGSISKATIEESVRILDNYRRVLAEYGVTETDQIRVVATSAVREADNRLAFLDRIYIATGLQVEPIDDAEVSRLTYLAIQPYFRDGPNLADGRTLVVEVGGGGTELLYLTDGDVRVATQYRLGSLRLPVTIKAYHAPTAKARQIVASHVRRTAERVLRDVPPHPDLKLVVLGGDARFAAGLLLPEWQSNGAAALPVKDLQELTTELLTLSVDDLVRKYRLTYPEAETLGPALQTYVRLARAYEREELLVMTANLRDGLLTEMAVGGAWTAAFSRQIIRSAIDLGRRFGFNEEHARHVGALCRRLFEALQDEHQLDQRYELILYIAALLHDIGNIVSSRSHHKHSMYLILNSDLFGFGRKDVLLVALVARYHRRAGPRPLHEGYSTLAIEDRISITKMAALLRVADALDRSETQRIEDIECRREDDRFVVTVPGVEDLSLEQLALRQKGRMFEDTFGMQVRLRKA